MQQKLHAQKNKLQRIKELHRKKKTATQTKLQGEQNCNTKNNNAKITAMQKTAALKKLQTLQKTATSNKNKLQRKQTAAQKEL